MRVAVIGGGISGLAVARELISKQIECVIIERLKVASGATGNCAGMLHSGARYAVTQPALAKECWAACKELKRTVKFAIGKEKGLFVCLRDDFPEYANLFQEACCNLGIDILELSREQAIKIEPFLSPEVTRVFLAPDTEINPFSLVDSHVEFIKDNGGNVLELHCLVSANYQDSHWILKIQDLRTGEMKSIVAEVVVNAAGAWSAQVGKIFGTTIELQLIQGSMFVLGSPLVQNVVTRCAFPTPGDVVIPSGSVTLIGSTSHIIPQPITQEFDNDLQKVIHTAQQMVPIVSKKLVVGVFTGIRTHLKHQHHDNCNEFLSSRFYNIIDHGNVDNIPGVYTVLGGKLVLHRRVANLLVNLIQENYDCVSHAQPLKIQLHKPLFPSNRYLGKECI